MIFDALADLICQIWKADTAVRTGSALGESEYSRRARRQIGWVCCVLLVLCMAGGIYWGW